ncbi:basic helix-loop-helix (bHLH) DNA-binding superfamily protein [Euphorbia peplus]|nr:basic helix-loop-helix (bHLH) DNA-binding superfamily protein [Euphorbia peplus]
MALDTLSSNEFMNFIIYDTISVSNYSHENSSQPSDNNLLLDTTSNMMRPQIQLLRNSSQMSHHNQKKQNLGVQIGRKKRRRRKARATSKNKEEAESQRMTHIAVERNRRKQMNDHLAVLRSLMPPSYVQRGDQASIVGGAIEFVKELEQLLQSLEAQKLQLHQPPIKSSSSDNHHNHEDDHDHDDQITQSYSTWSHDHQMPNNNNNHTSRSKTSIAEIEVTLIETHANLRILSRRSCPSQLSKLVSAFHSLFLTVLHINVTTFHPLVLYSISAKVEEQCQLTCVDDIAAAVHHMLTIIEQGAVLL